MITILSFQIVWKVKIEVIPSFQTIWKEQI